MTKSMTLAVAVFLGAAGVHAAADWPQWQGPDRTRISKETGLLKEWPAGGPRLIWTANNLGSGYGSMSVAGDRVYLQGARGNNSFVIALNRADGKEVWSKPLGPVETRMRSDRGAGPRGTPTVDGDRLYVLTENGDLACLKTDGSILWQRNILKEFGGSQLQWLVSESPLVDGPHLVVTPGGPGAGMVKLDKMTGKTVWTSKDLSDTAAYSSITVADVQGVRTYMTFTALRRRRRARVGRQADVPLSERREQDRERRDAGLLRQQSVLCLGVRDRWRVAEPDRAERRGRGDGSVLHARDEEPSWRHGARRWLPVRIQRSRF